VTAIVTGAETLVGDSFAPKLQGVTGVIGVPDVPESTPSLPAREEFQTIGLEI